MRINKMITEEKIFRSFIKFTQLILEGNIQRSVWRICMWILGLKGIKLLAQQENLLVTDYWTGLFSSPETVSIFLAPSRKTQ